MTVESWLPVVGFEHHYQVSNLGNVRSLPRFVPSRWGRRLRRGITLSPGLVRPGNYRQVILQKDGARTPKYVHVLVLESFVGVAPTGHECRHVDGNSQNNKLGNLCWGTKKENADDKEVHGTVRRGANHGSAILSDSQVGEIRRLAMLGCERQVDIADRFGITQAHVSRIKRGVMRV